MKTPLATVTTALGSLPGTQLPGGAFWADSVETVQADVLTRGETIEPRPRELPIWPRLVIRQFTSPVTLILVLAAAIATAVGDATDATIIGVIVVASASLGFWQEFRAAIKVNLLLGSVASTVTVTRKGVSTVVVLDDVMVGDVVALSAGDVIPADCRLIVDDQLTVDESALTGESFPVSKSSGALVAKEAPLAARINSVFRGSHVVSGTGTAIAVRIGSATEFGRVQIRLSSRTPQTAFETGITRFGMLLLRVMVVLVIMVFAINLLLGRPLADALLFSLALAVGVTPQMLPAIVSVSLASGARRLAHHNVVVKRLDVIENLGSLTVLCTDKTGTLTSGVVALDAATDPFGTASERVLGLAAVNAGLQRGYVNPLDTIIIAATTMPEARLLAEVPYDFERKRLSIAAVVAGENVLITKGSFDSVLSRCTSIAGTTASSAFDDIRRRYRDLSNSGHRVLGIARRVLADGEIVGIESESGLQFEGMLSFRDEVKPGVIDEISALGALGVRVVMVTGDNSLVAGSVAVAIGLRTKRIVTGIEIDSMSPTELRRVTNQSDVFAEVEPRHKEEIVAALRTAHETVGFLGDGINDSPALHAADVGISVDTATDVAREAASIVLLEKSLSAVAVGVKIGRRTFANTLKYVRFASSSNFGNVLSMVIASAILPFLPMLPGQILLLNFLADVPNTLISRDNVDPERLTRPGHWNMRGIRRFMLVFGVLSTVFDLVTFTILITVFHAAEGTFQSGWFIESALTQIVVVLSLRTQRPFFRSRPDTLFLVAALSIAVVTASIPFLPFAGLLGFASPTPPMMLALVGIAASYLTSTELLKRVSWAGFLDRGAPLDASRASAVVTLDPSTTPLTALK